MTLTEARQKKLVDLAIGKNVNSGLPIEAQIGALREQIAALSEAAKVPLCENFKVLVDLVEAEKAKKEKKAETGKKTTKKSK